LGYEYIKTKKNNAEFLKLPTHTVIISDCVWFQNRRY